MNKIDVSINEITKKYEYHYHVVEETGDNTTYPKD